MINDSKKSIEKVKRASRDGCPYFYTIHCTKSKFCANRDRTKTYISANMHDFHGFHKSHVFAIHLIILLII